LCIADYLELGGFLFHPESLHSALPRLLEQYFSFLTLYLLYSLNHFDRVVSSQSKSRVMAHYEKLDRLLQGLRSILNKEAPLSLTIFGIFAEVMIETGLRLLEHTAKECTSMNRRISDVAHFTSTSAMALSSPRSKSSGISTSPLLPIAWLWINFATRFIASVLELVACVGRQYEVESGVRSLFIQDELRVQVNWMDFLC
jgi:hypothetical protein